MNNEFQYKSLDIIGFPSNGGCPRLLRLSDGRLMIAVDGMQVAFSNDDGYSWSQFYSATKPEWFLYSGLEPANPSLIQLENGDILLAHRLLGDTEDGFYAALVCCVSHDGGFNWEYHSKIIDNLEVDHKGLGVYEPCFGYIEGVLTVFYADDSTKRCKNGLQAIDYKQWINGEWTNKTCVIDGTEHESGRPGMPEWIKLSNGIYLCALEGWYKNNPSKMSCMYTYSYDGKKWSTPKYIYVPTSGKAAGPYVTELPNKRLMFTFLTNEDATVKRDSTMVTKYIVSDGTAVEDLNEKSFSMPVDPFNIPDGFCALWSSDYTTGNIAYIATNTNYGTGGIRLAVFKF